MKKILIALASCATSILVGCGPNQTDAEIQEAMATQFLQGIIKSDASSLTNGADMARLSKCKPFGQMLKDVTSGAIAKSMSSAGEISTSVSVKPNGVVRGKLSSKLGDIVLFLSYEKRGETWRLVDIPDPIAMRDDIGGLGVGLVTAINAENEVRSCEGLPSIWPQTTGFTNASTSEDDIAGKAWKTSSEYFKALDEDRRKKMAISVRRCAFLPPNAVEATWILAANVKEGLDEGTPILISANVDPRKIEELAKAGDYDSIIPIGEKIGRGKFLWTDDFVVVIDKRGERRFCPADKFNLRWLTMNMKDSDLLKSGIKYLDVK